MAERIKALKGMTGWSFQRLTDEFWKTLLYKIQSEGDYFRDLTITKKIEYTVKDIVDLPSIKSWFHRKI
jgi:hypothetical protein